MLTSGSKLKCINPGPPNTDLVIGRIYTLEYILCPFTPDERIILKELPNMRYYPYRFAVIMGKDITPTATPNPCTCTPWSICGTCLDGLVMPIGPSEDATKRVCTNPNCGGRCMGKQQSCSSNSLGLPKGCTCDIVMLMGKGCQCGGT